MRAAERDCYVQMGRRCGCVHISSELHQGSFGSEPRLPLRLGLGPAVWSAPQFDGLYSHQPKRSAPRDQTRLVRTKHRKLLKKTKSVLNSQAAWLFRSHTMEHNLPLIDKIQNNK